MPVYKPVVVVDLEGVDGEVEVGTEAEVEWDRVSCVFQDAEVVVAEAGSEGA